MSSEALDKLKPNDHRVERQTFESRGHKWSYIVANPSSPPAATIILIHGFPDMGFGWRYQVSALLSLNLRVVVPDMLGYGRSDAPDSYLEYSFKNIAFDIRTLAAQLVGPNGKVILGGHDWGGAVVWRIALRYPELVLAVFSVCTPYMPPRGEPYLPLEKIVEMLPNFKYQLQWAGPDLENGIQGRDKLRQFFNGMYHGLGPNGERIFDTERGVIFERLGIIGKSPLLSEEEIEFYVEEFSRNGLHGPTNWYRTQEINWKEEQEFTGQGPEKLMIRPPSLMIAAKRDVALPPALTAKMDPLFDNLTKREVDAGHWALWEKPEEVNQHIVEFLSRVLKESKL